MGIVTRRAIAGLLVCMVGACDDGADGPPPDLVRRTADETVEVSPHSYSGPGFTADGPTIPPDGPDLVIDSENVIVEYPRDDWTFTVLNPAAGIEGTVQLEELPDGRYRLVPPATAGTYEIWLVGRDDEAGDASFVFRWIVGTD